MQDANLPLPESSSQLERKPHIIPFWPKASRHELSIELLRKSIHLLIGFVPLLLEVSRMLTIVLLSAGTCAYIIFEILRRNGIQVPLISPITAKAARIRDSGHFVYGPITLGLGALLSVIFFSFDSARIAVYILAFGDGLSSLVGKSFGKIRIPHTGGKSLEGSLTCFTVSLLSAFAISKKLPQSLAVALIATVIEAVPSKDWDNIILPLVAGATASLLGL